MLLDSSFDSGVDFRRFTAGWPWSYCSWGVGSALGVRTVDPDGGAVAGVAVEGRDAMGGTQAAAVSDALGKATLGLPLFSVDTEGSGIEQVTHVVQHNPYTVIGRFVEGEVQAAVEAGTPGMVVELVSSGDTGSVIPSPGEPSWSFEVLTTTPAGSAAKVPGGSEIRWLFTKPVLLDTITGPACAITGTLSGSIRGSFTLGLSGRLVVFRPDDGFAPGEEITASLSGQVRSQSGDFLDGNRDGLAGGSAEDAYELRFLVEGPAAP